MDKILVEGGHRLRGTIKVSGSKNAALPMLMSSLLTDGESTFFNVPRLDDVKNTLSLLTHLGAFVEFKNNKVKINSSGVYKYEAPYELVKKMRASILVLGPLIVRFGKARVSLPGGCSIGARPVDLHISALKKLGANIELSGGYINAVVNKRLKGTIINFEVPTVTGTENLIMASVLAEGLTILKNAACEPEIVALSQGLNNMGAKIVGAGTSKIFIRGVNKLYPVSHLIIPDRIEIGTFMVASILTKGDVNIIGCMPNDLLSIINKLRHIGGIIDIIGDSIRVRGGDGLMPINVETMPYPGFPTDMQPIFMTLLALSNGISTISETIFENRFIHTYELNRMGANIVVKGNLAIIKGVKSLIGTQVIASDLRGSASLILAGLVANGKTEVKGINHLDRGYEEIEEKIKSLGGVIKRVLF